MRRSRRQSDLPIVSKKSSNKADPAAETMERRGGTKRNSRQRNRCRTQGRESLENSLERVHNVAKTRKETRFNGIYHLIYKEETLRAAFMELKKNASSGVDGVSWTDYKADLDVNLKNLSQRLRNGAYRPLPVRRVHIPKADGKMRPLGVTAVEDKLVQAATAKVLNAIYEADFLDFSYGFRPKRNQHQALDDLALKLNDRRVNWVFDADICGFFDAMKHDWLITFVEHRITDKRVVRLIKKWLKAGVFEDGNTSEQERGTPQGGCISPLLANIYLHYVYDLWLDAWTKQRAKGSVVSGVRFADDTIVGFQSEADARNFLADIKKRFHRFGLELHPEKTKLIEFGHMKAQINKTCDLGAVETFQFLGFTHSMGYSRNGKTQLLRQTASKRLRGKLAEVKDELRRRINEPVPKVGKWLASVLWGHYRYYGVPLNYRALRTFHHQIGWLWQRAMSRRSHKGKVTLLRMRRLQTRWLPPPRIIHPYPNQRHCVTTRGGSRMR